MKKTKNYKGTDRSNTILINRENVKRNADGMLVSLNREISSSASADDYGIWHRAGTGGGKQYINFPSGRIDIRESKYQNSNLRWCYKWTAYRNGEVMTETVDGKNVPLEAETAGILKDHIETNYRK